MARAKEMQHRRRAALCHVRLWGKSGSIVISGAIYYQASDFCHKGDNFWRVLGIQGKFCYGQGFKRKVLLRRGVQKIGNKILE